MLVGASFCFIFRSQTNPLMDISEKAESAAPSPVHSRNFLRDLP